MPLRLEPRAIPDDSLIIITGCTGFIGSHVTDQVLAAGYRVRGTTRDSKQNAWVKDYFGQKYGSETFELVSVPDPAHSTAFDEVVKGASGFIHVAHDMTGSANPDTAIPHAINMATNALKSCHKAGLQRFVYTSSSFAITLPKSNAKFSVSESTFNEEAVQRVQDLGKDAGGQAIYAAAKVHVERALKRWKEEQSADIVINCINPNANIGLVLQPQHQGYPTSAAWVKNVWENNVTKMNNQVPEHFINVQDDAKLHVIALVHPGLSGRRLLGMVAPAPISTIAQILRKTYPARQFDEIRDDGTNECVNVEEANVEALLREAYGHGYTSLEVSVLANAKDLA